MKQYGFGRLMGRYVASNWKFFIIDYAKCIIFLVVIMQSALSYSQIIFGRIVDCNSNPMSFVNVMLLNKEDSTFVIGTITKDDGTFSIVTERQEGILRISCIGFETLYVNTHQGSIGDLRLKADQQMLREVTVTSSNVIHHGDKDVVWITRDMRRGNYNTGELLGNVPGIEYNRATKGLKYYGESNIVLLVDSVEKNADYIKGLHHVRFERIDIIPFPKGKYEGYSAIINLHTRADYEGYEGSAGIDTEFFPSNLDIGDKVFSNISGNGSFTYTRNKWNSFMNYAGSFNQSAKENLSEVEYPMNGYWEKVIANENHYKNLKEYERGHTLTGGVDYQFNKRNSLSIAYRLGLQANDSYSQQNVVQTQQTSDTILSCRHGDDNGYAHTFAAYYRGGVGAWNYTADFNLVLTETDACSLLQKSSGYVNQDDRHNHMTHTLARVELNRHFLGDKLYVAVGYNNFWKQYEQTRLQTSSTLTDYTLYQNKLWFYTSYNIRKNTSINTAASLIMNNTRSMGQKDDYLSYDASLGLYQGLGDNTSIRFNYQCSVSNPTINQVTTYGQFTDSLQWVGGNPLLRSAVSNNFDLRFQFCKWLTFIAKYKYQPRTFSSITELRKGTLENGVDGYYAATITQNSKYQNLWIGLYYWQRIKNLSLSADCYYRYAAGKYKDFQNSIGYWHGNFHASYNWAAINLNASAHYNLAIDKDAWAQGVSKNQVDMFWLYISKKFCHERIELSFTYVLPIHFTSGDNYRYVTTPAFVARNNDYSLNRQSDHNFAFGFIYRFNGGKTVREYNREMSEER